MIPSTLPSMFTAQPSKQRNLLPVDDNMLSKTVENKRDSGPGQRASQATNIDVSSNASILAELQKRASKLMAKAEALVQRIGFATEDQIPDLAKKLKQITNELKQIASRHKAMKSSASPMPTFNLSEIALSVSSSSQAIPASTPEMTTQTTKSPAVVSAALETTLAQAEGSTKIQAKAISSYKAVEQASAFDISNDPAVLNEQPDDKIRQRLGAQSENATVGLEVVFKKIQELLKIAAELLEKRISDITDREERKKAEDNLREAKADISDIDQMIGVLGGNVLGGLKNKASESLSLPSVIQTYVSDVTVSSVTISVESSMPLATTAY